jgi:hypothetical protein
MNKNFCNKTRREFLWEAGAGFTGLGLTGMLSADGFFGREAQASEPKRGKAKAVIFLYMYGGPSQMDTFDHKPELVKGDGKTVAIKSFRNAGKTVNLPLMGPKWAFKPYGKSGKMVSDLFPHVGSCVDDIAFLHGCFSDSAVHGSAMLQMNTGKILSGAPCLGAWTSYGLGDVKKNLPDFVVMVDSTGGPISGAKNWSSGYMPAKYQGAVLRAAGDPILDLRRPDGISAEMQRDVLDTLEGLNEAHRGERAGNSDLAARISSYELAYAMQTSAPEAVDISKEPEHIKELYGLNDEATKEFGFRCLLARRLVERGVRFIQLYAGGGNTNFLNFWDAHDNLVPNHNRNAGRVDKPIAGLLKDLKQRGLLDDVLIVWGGEFGRTAHATGGGRDHNAYGFTTWLAGGGIQGGTSYGATDELGYAAAVDPTPVKRIHATILDRLGLDPNNLSYFYNGLSQKLVGVEGADPIKEVMK